MQHPQKEGHTREAEAGSNQHPDRAVHDLTQNKQVGAANQKHIARRTKHTARNTAHSQKQKRKLLLRAPKKKRLQARTHSSEGTNKEV